MIFCLNLSELRQTCSKETHEDVDWPETAIDGVAVEPCPPGYKGKNVQSNSLHENVIIFFLTEFPNVHDGLF